MDWNKAFDVYHILSEGDIGEGYFIALVVVGPRYLSFA